MQKKGEEGLRVALVLGSSFDFEEIEQFDSSIVLICSVTSSSLLHDLGHTIISLPDYEDEAGFLPGLEQSLKDFDVVIVKGRSDFYSYQVLKAKNQYCFHFVVWIDDILPFSGSVSKKSKTIQHEVTNRADVFLVQSKDSYEALLIEGVHDDRILYVTPSVFVSSEKKDSLSARKSFGLVDSDFVIGYLGPLEFSECLYDLLYGLKYLFLVKPGYLDKIKVLILGKGSANSLIREKIIELNFESVVFFGNFSVKARNDFYQSIDAVFVSQNLSSQRSSGSPFRMLCPMSLKIPIISSRNPICQDLIGKHRFDYCHGSSASLALAIEKSLSEKNLRHDIVSKNYEKYCSRFSQKKSKSDFIDFFSSLIHKDIKSDYLDSFSILSDIDKCIKTKQYVSASRLIDHAFLNFKLNINEKSVLYRMTGDCFLNLGDKSLAQNSYNQSLDLDPFCSKSHIGLGTISIMKEQYELAIVHFQKAVSLSPKEDLGYLGLGLSFQGIGEYRESLFWIKKSLEFNPNNTSAIYSLVRVSYECGIFNDAETFLKKYIEYHPDDHSMVYALGGVLFKLEKYEESISFLKRIIDFNPKDQRALSLLKQAQKKIFKESYYFK